MTATEKWNRIVEYYNKHIGDLENAIESTWESIFADYFDYRRLEGEIDRQRKIPIGSTLKPTADIIIKSGARDLFVVELKRHSLSFDVEMESQLLSYLKLLRNNIGVLICNKIYIYAYDISKSDSKQEKIEIDFVQNNPDGVRFIELFSKVGFDENAIKEFVRQKITFARNVGIIESEITADLIADLLGGHFAGKYDIAEFEQAMGRVNISVLPKAKNAIVNKSARRVFSGVKVDIAGDKNRVGRRRAIEICALNGVILGDKINYANRAEYRDFYAIDPQIERLSQNWWLLLIDPFEKEMSVFEIPANALSSERIKFREKGASTFLLRFKLGDYSFEDTLSNIHFKQWLVKTIKF
ncbi:MAG: type I restriction enzyme HsdR N-terminal domain-containing protein [Defluviitaleaceae bacterium]|nr:type I restriction enzyme HsdR N-terminal domain-containing protein [Defluviitaleaceae bacterium]